LAAWALPAVFFLGSIGGTIAVCEWFFVGAIPSLLQGKWLVVEGELEGATLEFLKDGTLIGSLPTGGKEASFEGTVHMQGDGFRFRLKASFPDIAVAKDHTILDLTDQQLVIQGGDGEVLKMTRVRGAPGTAR
jgi:uncharacterized protein (TIGR03066 family)